MSQLDNLFKLEENNNLMDRLNKELYSLQNGSLISDDEAKYKELVKRLNQMEESLSTGKAKLRHSDYKLKEYELRLEDLDEELYSGTITNEKQLSYLTEERDRMSQLIEELETEILENMDIISQLEDELGMVKYKVSDFKESIDIKKQDINDQIEKLKKAKLQLEDNIIILNKNIDNELLQKYKRIRESKGAAIVLIEDGICGGCHIKVPNYLVEDLKRDKIVNCESCNRILYLPKTTVEK